MTINTSALLELMHGARERRILRITRIHHPTRLEQKRRHLLLSPRPMLRILRDNIHIPRPKLDSDFAVWHADIDGEQAREDVEELVGVVVFVPSVSHISP